MNKKQALQLLQLMGDLYGIINAPEPEPVQVVPGPGEGHAQSPATATNGKRQASAPRQPMPVD